ncbi:sensor domain-containing diguanylate cyclase [Pandoraea sputorum]|uniref:sensor domain-containing diguanylate cyclase n=1 Tax=Pandoraea sputorum TaxID=93222 RepID=UPI0012584B88|nr:sensor domain-containing diguanylate cyclase [Pandoraea sputorum]VVE82953.1 putative signaling protein [Pandoraea sputorum]
MGIPGFRQNQNGDKKMDEFLKRAASENSISFETLHIILDALPIAVSWGSFPDGTIRFVNRAFTRLFGYELSAFPTVEHWLQTVYETDDERLAIADYRKALEKNGRTGIVEIGPFECRVRCADGSFRTTLNREVMLWDIGIGVTTFEDISAQRKSEETIRRLALEDPLTGLGNRRAIHDMWQPVFTSCKDRATSMAAVIIADLDDFKPVNDRYGHEAGDELLKVIAKRLRRAVRESDLIARLGGDEFAMFLPYLDNVHQAERICQRISDAVTEPMIRANECIRIGISIGASLYPRDGDDLVDLLRLADQALYRRKNAGKSGWEWFS